MRHLRISFNGLKHAKLLMEVSIPPASSQITTQRLIISYKCSADSLGLLLTNSYNLTLISYLHSTSWFSTFSQHCMFILFLLGSHGNSTLLILSVISVWLSYLTSSLPSYWSVNSLLNQWGQYIFTMYKRIIPQKKAVEIAPDST